MSLLGWLVIAGLVLGGVALAMRTRRLIRISRRQQERIDYSRIRRWEDDDD